MSRTRSRVPRQCRQARRSSVKGARNTFCISCRCHKGKDRFFPVFEPHGPVLKANPEEPPAHWDRFPSNAALRSGAALKIGRKGDEVVRGGWKGRHRSPAGLAATSSGRFRARGWLLTFLSPRHAGYHNDSETRGSVLEERRQRSVARSGNTAGPRPGTSSLAAGNIGRQRPTRDHRRQN